MRYRLSDETQADAAFTYLSKLSGKHALVEVKEIKPTRSLPQNAFFHLLLTYFGLQVGYTKDDPLTIEEAKIYIQRHMSDVFVHFKNGDPYFKSSADLTTEEMTLVIDRMYRLAADMGITLPQVDNEETRNLMANEIEQSKY